MSEKPHKRSPDYVVMRTADGALWCMRCGEAQEIALPVSVSRLVVMIDDFAQRHLATCSDLSPHERER